MALAYAQYPGNGTTTVFNVTFPYLHKDHVQVKVNGNLVAFTWNSATQVKLTTAPPSGSIVDVRRVTPRDKLLVDFLDGSTLVESDLDLSAIQVFYLAQEAFDLGEASLGVTDDGSFSALNRRISNILDPVNDMDAVNKRWAETGMTSQLNIATQKANEASASASNALSSKNAAATSATNAANSASTATTKASEAATSATNAANSASSALSSKNAAATSATNAANSAADAAASAAAAAQSAQDAALFDPSSYYTKTETYSKTQIDATFATKTTVSAKLDASAYTASDVLTKLKTVDGNGSGLDGDTLRGAAPATASTGNTIAQRDSNGDINARLFRSEYDTTNSNIGYIVTQVNTGTDNYMRPSTLAQVAATLGPIMTADKVETNVSGEFTPTLAGLITWAHGLGVKPSMIDLYMICKVAEHGYAVNDEIGPLSNYPTYADRWVGYIAWADATNVYVRVQNGNSGNYLFPAILNQDTGNALYATLANWRMKIKVRK
jgi:hypothetical protein